MPSFNCNNNLVRDSCFANARHGRSCSKAQAYLEKILHLISTIPPPCESNPNPLKNTRRFHIDLNLRFTSFSGVESEAKSESSAENSSFTENPDSENEIEEKTGTEVSSDVTEIQKNEELLNNKNGSDGEVKPAAGFHDSLDLLIEAAEMISDRDHGLKEIKEGEEVVEDRLVNVVGEYMSAPVVTVRSKRGRSQVSPCRFRDSVLEPWKKGEKKKRNANERK